MGYLQSISRKISLASLIAAYVTAVMFGMLVILVMAEIIRRAVFGSSFLWTFELSSWLLVGIAFMGLAYTLKTGGHVRVTLVSSRLAPRGQNLLEIVLCGIGLAFTTYLATYIFRGMLSTYTMNVRGLSVLEPPIYVIWVAAFIGLCFFSLQFVGIMLDRIVALKEKEKATPSGN